MVSSTQSIPEGCGVIPVVAGQSDGRAAIQSHARGTPVRYIDINQLRGQTADGEPATLSHWRRYTLLLLLVFGGVWVLVHVLDVRTS